MTQNEKLSGSLLVLNLTSDDSELNCAAMGVFSDAIVADGIEDGAMRLQVDEFAAVLISCDKPGLREFEAIHGVNDLQPNSPIVLLAASCDNETTDELIVAGAQEVLCKEDVSAESLIRSIRQAITRQKKLVQFRDAAFLDGLTGIANRRALDMELDRQLALSRRNVPFSLLLIDIDHFKAFNDQHGHLVGDHVLRDVAELLPRDLRRSDLVARFGGEEFAIVLPATDLFGAEIVAERLRLSVFANVCEVAGKAFQVSASIGVAMALPEDDQNSLVQRADSALYSAKDFGRNCCFVHDEDDFRLIEAMNLARSTPFRKAKEPSEQSTA